MKLYFEQGDRVKLKGNKQYTKDTKGGDVGIVMEHDLFDCTILVKTKTERIWVGENEVLYHKVKEEELCL